MYKRRLSLIVYRGLPSHARTDRASAQRRLESGGERAGPRTNERHGGARYWQAFQVVEKSIGRVLKGENPGVVAEEDHREWYRGMFAPSVTAGILRPSYLAGYRNRRVYIQQSRHVPLNRDAVRDAMPAFFELLTEATDPAVRVALGHFVLVYIHPYMDGNGRVGRFPMNVMMAAGGYPWTVIPLPERQAYMGAVERASVGEDIGPFADFLSVLVKKRLAGELLRAVPKRSDSKASVLGRVRRRR